MEMLPTGFEWNQAVLKEQDQLQLAEGLIAVLAWAPSRSMRPIGTGFIVGSRGNRAVAISAAHVFGGVQTVQYPRRHHLSALAEFVPNADLISLDCRNLRALCMRSPRPEFCIIDSVALVRSSDLALLTLHTQNEDSFSARNYVFNSAVPEVDDIVAVLGYADMHTLDEYQEGDRESFTMQLRPVCRVGRVKAFHPQGHSLCRDPCIETTIPVFHQMSGGPACLAPSEGASIIPFGFISSEVDNFPDVNNERSRAGSSIISLLPHTIAKETKELGEVLFELVSFTIGED